MQEEKGIYNQYFTKLTFLYWFPRFLGVLFIAFLAVFAFDVFVPGKPFLEIIGGSLIHLIPNYVLLIALVIAWKKEELGGFLFILVGIFFTAFFHTYEFLPNFMLISFPIFSIGMLFLIHNLLGGKTK